ncbi:16S rRNA (cytosine(1402)-N(4))-methyltransferase RsmH [Pelagibius sp.]|uniref:16S rRNA (cytosine(1402)-N(4))-methyltransferase RsmH n=1 Tax=Pelagibius sp. TaxID=1931238 RepID=UPI002AC344E4|nr:16S rRNA (cytosine(1402)-N(4))-methyltransferase RsmH [Pelagibius sp.]
MTERSDMPGGAHKPVLLAEVLEALAPRDGAIYVDGTFGAGGYSRAILEAADCTVWGIDRDRQAVRRGRRLAERYPGRLHILEGRFGEMESLLNGRVTQPVDGIALDLGVSSMQLDEPERGFSFRFDGPLDMRMEGPHIEGRADAEAQDTRPSAAEVVNSLPEAELADIIYRFGEERRSRQVARAIVEARRDKAITRTGELAELVRGAVASGPRRGGAKAIDPATRTFQALRIYVNDELGELERGLEAAEALLAPGGRLAVVSFHSLEDRQVKHFLRERSGKTAGGSRHLPPAQADARSQPTFRLLFRGSRRAGEAECRDNPRARSAHLRAAERSAAPAQREARPS